MPLRILHTCLLICSLLSGAAQNEGGFVLSRTFEGDIVDFKVDKLGNIYVLSSDNRLKKLGPGGDSLAVFNNVRLYGKLSSFDVSNPLKILLYYREFATIVVVDRFLNVLNTIDLRSLNIFQSKAVGLAYDNNIWVFDELEAKLKRIAADGSLIDQTADMRQIVDTVPDPSSITDQSGLVYLYDSAQGVYIFDHYGAFRKHLQLPGWEDFAVIEKSMLGRNRQYFFKYQIDALRVEEEPVPAYCLHALKVIIQPGTLYVLKQNGIEVYSAQ
jgi:hypothetical protein